MAEFLKITMEMVYSVDKRKVLSVPSKIASVGDIRLLNVIIILCRYKLRTFVNVHVKLGTEGDLSDLDLVARFLVLDRKARLSRADSKGKVTQLITFTTVVSRKACHVNP